MPNTEKVDILVVSAYRGWFLLLLIQRHMVVLPCSACVYVYSNTISILYIGLAHHIFFFFITIIIAEDYDASLAKEAETSQCSTLLQLYDYVCISSII